MQCTLQCYKVSNRFRLVKDFGIISTRNLSYFDFDFNPKQDSLQVILHFVLDLDCQSKMIIFVSLLTIFFQVARAVEEKLARA